MSEQPQELWSLAPMSLAHLQQMLDIERRAYEFPWTETIFRDCLHAGYSNWIVTNSADGVLAYAVMSMAAGEAHILNLCVDPNRQRQGRGRCLVSTLERH